VADGLFTRTSSSRRRSPPSTKTICTGGDASCPPEPPRDAPRPCLRRRHRPRHARRATCQHRRTRPEGAGRKERSWDVSRTRSSS
jgi:hypothetical protein